MLMFQAATLAAVLLVSTEATTTAAVPGSNSRNFSVQNISEFSLHPQSITAKNGVIQLMLIPRIYIESTFKMLTAFKTTRMKLLCMLQAWLNSTFTHSAGLIPVLLHLLLVFNSD
jgi:hypothetical protein